MRLFHPSLSALPLPDLIRSTALQYNLDPSLLLAVARRESALNPNAVSAAGAVGLMQLMPGTASMLGVTNPFDPVQSANAGAQYLAQLQAKYGSTQLALMAYNWGPGNVDSWLQTGAGIHGQPVPSETQAYVASILAATEAGSGGALSPLPGSTDAIAPTEAAPVTILEPVAGGIGVAVLLGAGLVVGLWAYSR